MFEVRLIEELAALRGGKTRLKELAEELRKDLQRKGEILSLIAEHLADGDDPEETNGGN